MTNTRATSSLSKLSSGTRVLTAKDDAASLAIGKGLQVEVESLKQAQVNTGQALSMLQIADGALSTISDILSRMKSLSVQSSSGQLSATERTFLNDEFVTLRSEIERIAQDTEFAGTTLLNDCFDGLWCRFRLRPGWHRPCQPRGPKRDARSTTHWESFRSWHSCVSSSARKSRSMMP